MVYANARFLQLIGIEGMAADALINWVRYVYPEDEDLVTKSLLKTLNDKPMSGEGRVLRPCDGQTVWLFQQSQVTVTPDRVSGKVTGTLSVLSDVTEQKMLESERLAALQRAEQESRQRALDAEEHRRQQELFVDTVCHEIRNPLNGIVNAVDLIRGNLEKRSNLIGTLDSKYSYIGDWVKDLIDDDTTLINSIDICMNHQVSQLLINSNVHFLRP